MLQILIYIGILFPLLFLPLPRYVCAILCLVVGVCATCLPFIGSILAIGEWIWAAVVVFQAPFSWITVAFCVVGVICVVRFLLAILADLAAMNERGKERK